MHELVIVRKSGSVSGCDSLGCHIPIVNWVVQTILYTPSALSFFFLPFYNSSPQIGDPFLLEESPGTIYDHNLLSFYPLLSLCVCELLSSSTSWWIVTACTIRSNTRVLTTIYYVANLFCVREFTG